MNKKKNLYIETYGCQMNFSDSEVVASILEKDYLLVNEIENADLILINTCSIRDNAEKRIKNRLNNIKHLKKNNQDLKIGIIGCMAERMKEAFFEKDFGVDLVFGPDAYRDLPKQILSEEETYDNINPVRIHSNGISAYISIMRGCENYCSYCVVPYTRGKERSRNPETILSEAEKLFSNGYKEITVLGQNVNSYNWKDYHFPQLIDELAQINNQLRIRFATSHPKDLSDELIDVIKNRKNICRSIHLPVQSGSNDVLKRMNRKYTREWYLDRVNSIHKHIKDCTISTDIISGFCGETEKNHKETLSLMEEVGYYYAFMFKYSDRPGTKAHKKMKDDVSEDTKSRRLQEIIQLQQKLSLESNKKDLGKEFEVLVEGKSKRSQNDFFGRTSQNKVVVFSATKDIKAGDYTNKIITKVTAATLINK